MTAESTTETMDLAATAAEVLDWLRGAAEKGADFVTTQAPLVAQEWVRWELVSGIYWIVLGLLGIYLGYSAFRWGAPRYKPTGDVGLADVALVFGPIVALACLIPLCCGSNQALKAAVAPRVVVMEKIAEMAR